jgi:hypothetical protein
MMLDLLLLGRSVCVAPQWQRGRPVAGRPGFERVLARAAVAMVRRFNMGARVMMGARG